jgi:N-methylhydantoinase A/oxoprolinase/acetone carboxylase beta subunit
MNLGLGIDTGGTYTDSSIIDLDTGKVVAEAKALTTRNDLSIGISNSIAKLDVKYEDIRLVSVSSTLATNSVVEGKGCRVALIVVGNEYSRAIPIDDVLEIPGGHTLNGEAKASLDLAMVEEFVRNVMGKIDGFAVSSYLSVRNPEHEIAIKDLIGRITKHPVVCGNELSSKLGFHERTVTAVLNAKLIPIIADLVAAVKKVLQERHVDAPLMIVKGDGSLMGEDMAKEKPVETVLSGPAASLIGAKFLTRENNAVVIDVGGTTTDIGILRDGKPRLDPEGAIIGGWRTRVKAADISTSGIGGDSRIVVANGNIILSPLRVIPICIAASIYPCIKQKLKAMAAETVRPQAGHIAVENIIQTTEFFIFSKDVPNVQLSKEEGLFIEKVREEPRGIYEVGSMTNVHPYSFNVRKLEELGMIQRIGLTPTDVLHAEGSYIEYDAEASTIVVTAQASNMEMEMHQFCAEVKRSVINKISSELLKKLVYEETGKMPRCDVCNDLFNKFITHEAGIDYSVRLTLNKPIIGIGAPVGAYLPAVAENFGTRLILPQHSEVGNAVGAITGSILESVEVLIRPKPGVSTMDNPPCSLHTLAEKKDFPSVTEASAYAVEWATGVARTRALEAGADEVEIVVDRDERIGHLGKSWGNGILLESRIVVSAVGKPRLFFEAKR